jgi:hypothetical protein
MADTSRRNEHYIFVDSWILTQEQLAKALKSCFATHGLECDFTVVVVLSHGEYLGYGYIWISDPKVYRMLIGEDENGNCIQTEIVNRNWVPPTDIDQIRSDLKNIIQRIEDMDFDTWEETKEMGDRRKELEAKCTPDTLLVSSKAQIALPPVIITEEQRLAIAYRYDDKKSIPISLKFNLAPATWRKDKADINQDVLYATGIPKWINEKDIVTLFKRYVKDITTEHQLILNRRRMVGTYPFVTILNIKGKRGRPGYRVAYVYFEPNTYEGREVISVCRMIPICKTTDGIVRETTLFFNHPQNNYD